MEHSLSHIFSAGANTALAQNLQGYLLVRTSRTLKLKGETVRLQLMLAREERPSTSQPCECEHVAHFERHERTPLGNPAHKYGTKYAPGYMKRVTVSGQTMNLCRDCREDCHHAAITPRPRQLTL